MVGGNTTVRYSVSTLFSTKFPVLHQILGSPSLIILASVPDYLLRPQYQTRDQKHINNMEIQLSNLATMMKELQTQNASIQRTLNDNLVTLQDVGVWWPQIDAKVDDLHKSVTDLRLKVDHLISHPPATDRAKQVFDNDLIDLTKPTTAHLVASSSEAASGPLGHDKQHSHWGIGNGVVTTIVPTLVKGANSPLPTFSSNFSAQQFFALNQAIPQQEFPKFDGMSPKLWKKL